MPRYFFHILDGTNDIDEMGHDMPDDAAARREAVRYCGSLLIDDPDLLLRDKDLRVHVANDVGALRFSIVMLALDPDLSRGVG